MLKYILPALILIFFGTDAQGTLTYQGKFNPNLPIYRLFQYENPRWQRSIIYIFTNGSPCYECPETISLIQQIYNQNYANLYSLQIINYQTDTMYNYAQTFNLTQPLEVVLAKVENGTIQGYMKLEHLENQISDVVSFSDFIENRINQYLGN